MIKLISRTDGKIAVTILGIISLLLLVVFVFPVMKAYAVHCVGGVAGTGVAKSCIEDVNNTKHNLNKNLDIAQTGTTEVCVFCHTPHGFRNTGSLNIGGSPTVDGTAGTAQAPLWNRRINQPANYTAYNGPNFDATPGTPKGVSLACLSCHDGAISFDALVNAPGSGGFMPTNKRTEGPDTEKMGLTFPTISGVSASKMAGTNRPTGTTGGFLGGLANFVGSTTDPFAIGQTASFGMGPFPNLGTDLSDDHPISMAMPATDPQFADVLNNRLNNIDGGTSNEGIKIAYVSRYGNQTTPGTTVWSPDKRDRIRLYPSAGGTGGVTDGSVFVECASCHNPHTPRTLFLRLPTVSSGDYSCTDCSIKGGGFGTTLVTTGTDTVPTFNSTTGRTNDLSHMPNQGSLVCLSCHQK